MRPPLIRRLSPPAVVAGLAAAGTAVAAALAGVFMVLAAPPTVTVTTAAGTAPATSAPPATSAASAPPATSATVAARTRVAPPDGAVRASAPSPGRARPSERALGSAPAHLLVPDVIATVSGGLTTADLRRLRGLGGVRAVLAVDGARITVNGVRLTVLAAPADALRPWTPPGTAASSRVWTAFDAGDLVTSTGAAAAARLASGGSYPVAAAVRGRITDGGTAQLGVTGVDGVVSEAEGRRLGLVRDVAVLVNAPAADMTRLAGEVQASLGSGARAVRLVPVTAPASLPVDATPSSGRPASYLQLFQESAARYCPGLSWTVLAAIGQIESGDGQNMGPSSAGALGPMQFMPSTWAQWGIDGFGDTGPPNIMNPFDAVPSAARLLCADGATRGSAGLRQAIFDYNHATWYVDEVLALAAEYARG